MTDQTIIMRHSGINDGTVIITKPPAVTLLQAARAVAAKMQADLAKARAKELRDISDPHVSPAEHYWQNRHRLQRQCEAIDAIVAVLEEEREA